MSTTFALHTDEDLLIQLKRGEEQALKMIFNKYYAPLYRFAREMLKERLAAEDAVQDVMLKIWEKRDTLIITTALKSYLYMAVRNHCLNQLKIAGRKNWLEDGIEDDSRFSTNDVADILHAKSLEHKIQIVIENMPPKCALIFKMSRFEGKSYKEMAEDLGLSVKTIENQMGKALQIMREQLQPYIKEAMLMLLVFFKSMHL